MIAFFKRIAGMTLVAILVVLAVGAGHAQAGAAAGASQAAQNILPEMQSMVQQVHGCHRDWRIGPYTGIRHRHVGPHCEWVRAPSTGDPCRRWRKVCRNRCIDFGAYNLHRCIHYCMARNAPSFCLY